MILLHPPKGAKKSRKRRGRGSGSGHGKTSCKGHKGQKARSGKLRPGFEGGQMPLARRLPKRGFTSRNKRVFQVVNVSALTVFDKKDLVTPESLEKAGIIRRQERPVKILGTGTISTAIEIHADAFSPSAQKKIEEAGGKITKLNRF